MEDTIKAIRSRLYRKNVSGISNEQIRKEILAHCPDGQEVTKEIKDAVYEKLLKDNLVTRLSEDQENGTINEETKMEPINEEAQENGTEQPNFLALLDSAKNQNTEMIVSEQASSMGLTLAPEMISNIALVARSQKSFNQDQFAAIGFALKSFIDFQNSQQQNGFHEMVGEVKQHAHQKAVELNNSMAGELSEFFRSYQGQLGSDVRELVAAINCYKD